MPFPSEYGLAALFPRGAGTPGAGTPGAAALPLQGPDAERAGQCIPSRQYSAARLGLGGDDAGSWQACAVPSPGAFGAGAGARPGEGVAAAAATSLPTGGGRPRRSSASASTAGRAGRRLGPGRLTRTSLRPACFKFGVGVPPIAPPPVLSCGRRRGRGRAWAASHARVHEPASGKKGPAALFAPSSEFAPRRVHQNACLHRELNHEEAGWLSESDFWLSESAGCPSRCSI